MDYFVQINTLEAAVGISRPSFQVAVSRGAAGPAGRGVPAGGTAGQVLEKIDGTDYNTQWADPTGGVPDGDKGDVVVTGGGLTWTIASALKAAWNAAYAWVAFYGSAVVAHLTDYNNPHQTTKTQVGLSNVDNTSDANKPISTATQAALDGKVDKVAGKSLLADTEISRLASMTAIFTTALQAAYDGAVAWISTNGAALTAHITNTLNPHNTTAAQVGAVATNAAITGATKTKITYDTKGLVTAGADATTADIADSTNRRYVTDAQLVVVGNTSGTNTGDQTITLTGDVTGSGTGSFATTIAAALKTAWDSSVTWIATNGAALIAHLSNTSNPHSTTAVQVGAEPTITGGLVSQYWAGTKTWRDFATDAMAAVVTRLLPSGGTTGQVLAKVNGTDYNVSWQTASGGIGGSGTTGTIPAFTAATTLGDSPITRSGTKVAINGAAFLRQLNVYATGLDARMYFHGPAASNPGVELGTDTTGTRRILWRLLESGVSGTTQEFYVTPSAGGTLLAMQIGNNAQITNSFLIPAAGIVGEADVFVDELGRVLRGGTRIPTGVLFAGTYANTLLYNAIVAATIQRNSLRVDGQMAIISFAFDLTNNTGSSQTWSFRVRDNTSVVIYEDTIQALATNAAARFCTGEIKIIRLSNTTYYMLGVVRIGQPGTPTTGLGELGSGGGVVYTFGATGTLSGSQSFTGNLLTYRFDIANGSSSPSHSYTSRMYSLQTL